jgi:hypothetical protein
MMPPPCPELPQDGQRGNPPSGQRTSPCTHLRPSRKADVRPTERSKLLYRGNPTVARTPVNSHDPQRRALRTCKTIKAYLNQTAASSPRNMMQELEIQFHARNRRRFPPLASSSLLPESNLHRTPHPELAMPPELESLPRRPQNRCHQSPGKKT